MTRRDDGLFEDACKAADIVDVARSGSEKLRRSGSEWRGLCPLSGCGGKSPSFVVQPGR